MKFNSIIKDFSNLSRLLILLAMTTSINSLRNYLKTPPASETAVVTPPIVKPIVGKGQLAREIQRIKINKLPETMQKEIDILRKEEEESHPIFSRPELCTALAIACIGALGALFLVTAKTFSPWLYIVSIGLLIGGGVSAKNIFNTESERIVQIKELEDCKKDLIKGWNSPFRTHLNRSKRTDFTLSEVMDIYRSFKTSQNSL